MPDATTKRNEAGPIGMIPNVCGNNISELTITEIAGASFSNGVHTDQH